MLADALNGKLKAYCVSQKKKFPFDRNPRVVKYANGTVAIKGNALGCKTKNGDPVRMSLIVGRDSK